MQLLQPKAATEREVQTAMAFHKPHRNLQPSKRWRHISTSEAVSSFGRIKLTRTSTWKCVLIHEELAVDSKDELHWRGLETDVGTCKTLAQAKALVNRKAMQIANSDKKYLKIAFPTSRRKRQDLNPAKLIEANRTVVPPSSEMVGIVASASLEKISTHVFKSNTDKFVIAYILDKTAVSDNNDWIIVLDTRQQVQSVLEHLGNTENIVFKTLLDKCVAGGWSAVKYDVVTELLKRV